MRLQSLTHLIEVVRAVARPTKVCLLGSASLLPPHPELGGTGSPLELTTDADFLLEPVNEAIAESLQLAAGRDSAFMAFSPPAWGWSVVTLAPGAYVAVNVDQGGELRGRVS